MLNDQKPFKGITKARQRKPRGSALQHAEDTHPVGRPTLYRPEYCAQMLDFFGIDLTRTESIETPDGRKSVEKVNLFPTLTRFATSIGVTRQALWTWSNAVTEDGALAHPEFFNAYARCKDLQESLLIEGGMAGSYEPRFASLAAKNLIGWRDRTDVQQETTLIAPTTEQLDAFYAERVLRGRDLDTKAQGRAERIADLKKSNG